MTQHENEYLDLQEFEDRMDALSAQIETVGKLKTKMRFVKGVNQTMALECDRLSPGFISSRNPVAAYSVLPTSTNFKLALEELDKLQIGALVALGGIALAIIWKLVKMIRKWFGSEDGDKGGSGGESSSSNYVAPARASAIINDSLDIARSIDQVKKDLVSASLKAGAVSQLTATKEVDDAVAAGYAVMHKTISQLFEDFAHGTGPVQKLKKLFDGSLKEAPTKLRDAYNRLEQIVSAYTSSSDKGARLGEIDKLNTMAEEAKQNGSYWYAGDISNAASPEVLFQSLRMEIQTARGTLIENKTSHEAMQISTLIDKMKAGLHTSYEKLVADIIRLVEEIEKDLGTKLESLNKKINRDLSHESVGDDNTDFIASATKVMDWLKKDIVGMGSILTAARVMCDNYAAVVGALPKAHDEIISSFNTMARKVNATEVRQELIKIKVANDKLIKKSK